MNETALAQQLTFVVTQRHEDEAHVLAQAMRRGIQAMYHEALIESYLLKQTPREVVLKELGPDQLDEIEYQRDALQRDVAWGRQDA